MPSRKIIILLIILTLFTRFYGLNWGNGNYFHPDENNMATALSQLSWTSNLNPHFFSYGQFPLYLGYLSLSILGLANSFSNSIFILRLWSAIFSILSVLLLFYINKNLTKTNYYLLPLLAIFTPGLIQLAHFGTTESLLILVFLANILLGIKYLQKPGLLYIFIAAFITGLGLGSKLTAIFFAAPILIAILFKNLNLKFLLLTIYFGLLTIFFALISSPYSLIEFSDFKSAISYESQVATGSLKVFYTNQFLHTTPYLYQLINIFPYALGLPVFILSVFSIFYLFFHTKYRIPDTKYLVIFFPAIVYFIYNGQLYTKWFRFMSPIFFLFLIPAALFLNLLLQKKRVIGKIVLTLCLLPGVIFYSLYFNSDIRLTASLWMNDNLPPNSTILSEAGNVVNIPTPNHTLSVDNFDFYNLDSNPDRPRQLITSISKSEYILIPSRRIFMNQYSSHPQRSFPISQKYYQSLFNGDLGYQLIKVFKPSSSFFLDSELAEETYSVFDQPTIRLYKKVKFLTTSEINQLIL